jgi:hypothetical protein
VTNNAARNQVFSQMETRRLEAAYAARTAFAAMTPTQRAGELIARMDVARQHGNKAAFLAAQDELKTLVEEL